MLFKENNPSPPPPSPLGAPHPFSHPSSAKIAGAKNCKRRLDFNHNLNDDKNATFDLDAHGVGFREILNVSLNASREDGLGVFLASAKGAAAGGGRLSEVTPRLTNDPELAVTPGRAPTVAVARRNERERNRVKLINMTFATLREHLPQYASKGGKNRKMSKVETLRAAIDYIRQLQTLTEDVAVVKEEKEEEEEPETAGVSSPTQPAPHHHAVSSPSSSLGAPRSPSSDDCCSSYDQLSPGDDHELLDFATWF
ncbi:hypothetical protein C0Q70_10620 [Pomacea canaliculata]|uniref:BHLH domain-containing protein n=1 Tax=Pomacea canaliculata TaxID=400727 RepID=A0A2T7P3P7_POMCA|nr:hypothetical protein C0Q70_10620 [Pomacea canaliculata]